MAIAVVAALVVRGAFLWLRGSYLTWDEAMYLLLARSYLLGDGPLLNGMYHTALGTFVPLATALLAKLFGLEPLVAQRVLTAVTGSLVLVPVWYILRLGAGARVAWIAVSLLVAWPALVDVAPKRGPLWSDMYAGSEPIFLLFLFTFVATTEAALRRRGKLAMLLSGLAGASLALAYASRAEAIVFGGLYLAVRAALWMRTRDGRQPLAGLALVVATFLVFAAPQLVYLKKASGSWIISGQTAVMAPAAETLQEAFRDDRYLQNFVRTWYRLDAGHTYLLNPYWGTPEGVSRELQASRFAQLAAVEAPKARSLPARVANRLWNYLYMLWTLPGALLPLVLVGIVAAGKRQLPAFAIVGFAASLVTSLYLAALPRFFLYLIPAYALWAAYAIEAIANRFAQRREAASRVVVLAVIAFSLFVVGRRATGELAQNLSLIAAADRLAGVELKTAIPDGDAVMHWHPRFAYWAGWDWRTMPISSLDALAHYASRLGVRYALLARGGYTPVRPGVPYLLVVLDDELQDSLRVMHAGHAGPHDHPPMILREIEPIAGYPSGVLELDFARESDE